MTAARDMGRWKRSRRAFNITELFVGLAALLVLAAILLPVLARTHGKSNRVNCTNNVKQVGLGFRIWSGDNRDQFPVQVSITNGGLLEMMPHVSVSSIFRVMSNELGATKIVLCPSDIERAAVPFFDNKFTDRNVSYFVGLDAQGESPDSVLVGDRNLTANRKPVGSGLIMLSTNQTLGWDSNLHRSHGNLCFGDGSVQPTTAAQLQQAFSRTGFTTNRLTVP